MSSRKYREKNLCPNTEAANTVIEWLIYTYATIVRSRKKNEKHQQKQHLRSKNIMHTI